MNFIDICKYYQNAFAFGNTENLKQIVVKKKLCYKRLKKE